MYGPTETTVWSTCKRITCPEDLQTIGKPIANTRIYLLGARHELLPIGLVGEICIGGDGLASGYHQRPDLTTERFISHPFEPGERLYCTGDLGKWTAQGEIEYLGRKDDQVKIRGYRIELGEIENALLQHPQVENAVVVARKDADHSHTLAAYLVCPLATLDLSEIRSFLGQDLPEYMLPSDMTVVTAFPLTPNGKVDRKALQAMQLTPANAERAYVVPANTLEEKLVEIWQVVLNRKKIGVMDRFFELGGHSLKATQVVSRVRQELGREMELRSLYTHPTVRALAALLARTEPVAVQTIVPIPIQDHYEVSHAQRRLWITNYFEENQLAFNMVGRCELLGDLQYDIFCQAFRTLVERHEILRTTFVSVAGEPRQVVHPAEDFRIDLTYVDVSDKYNPPLAAEHIFKEETRFAFDLEKGPLMRITCLRLTAQQHQLLFNMHHIVSDGWSLEVLVNEICALYKAYVAGESNPLVPLRIQYKDYTAWYNRQLAGTSFLAHQSYWVRQFEGGVPVLELPTDFPRPAILGHHGVTAVYKLEPSLSQALKHTAEAGGVTLFTCLLTSVNTLLYRYSGQKDIIVGVPLGGRDQLELENQIGFYTNMIPFRSQFDPNQPFRELLQQISHRFLEAYPHGLYPFDLIVKALQLPNNPSRSKLFDVMLQYQDFRLIKGRKDTFGGLNFKALEADVPTSKFDLTFAFEETDNQMELSITYNTDLFKAETIGKMKDEWVKLIQLVSQHDQLSPVAFKKHMLGDTELMSYATNDLTEEF